MTILTYLLIGLTVGSISGALGIGGGVVLVPALMWLCGFDAKKATGTSLAILALPIGLPAALHAYRRSQVELDAAVWIAGAFVVGAITSRILLEQSSDQMIRFLFGLLLIWIAVRFILSADAEATNALAGVAAVSVALLSLLFLRWLGRRHLPAPDLGDEIRKRHEQGYGDPDYYI